MSLPLLGAGPSSPTPPVPPFDPSSIAGMLIWLDSSDAATVWQNSNGTTPAAADGDPVGRWSDKSGNNRHATQADGTKKPSIRLSVKNGKNAIQYDGVNDTLALSATLTIPRNCTVFMVTRQTAAGFQMIFEAGDPDTMVGSATSGNGILVYSNSMNFFNSTFTTVNVWRLHQYNQSNTQQFLVSNSQSFTRNVTTSAIGMLNMGVRNSSSYWNGYMAEIIIYNSQLSSGNIASVTSYLNNKWSVY